MDGGCHTYLGVPTITSMRKSGPTKATRCTELDGCGYFCIMLQKSSVLKPKRVGGEKNGGATILHIVQAPSPAAAEPRPSLLP